MTEGPYKLPEGWRWVRLGEACLPTERRDPTKDPSALFLYVDISAVDNSEGKIASPRELLGQDAPSRARKVIRSGDVIFATTRPYLKNVAMVGPELDGQICSTGFCVLRANRSVAEPCFLFYLCRSDLVVAQLSGNNMRGASYPAVTERDVYEALIPLPPLDEQRRIVARVEELMTRVREARRLRQGASDEAERLMQAVLAEVFPRPGAEPPTGWRWVRLGEVCQHRTGTWGPEASNLVQGFPIVRSTEIDGLFIRPQAASVRVVRSDQVDAYKLETGDILVNKSSGSPHLVGWPAIFEDPQDGRIYLFSNFMLRLRADRRSLEPWFLLYYLHSPIARSIYLGAQDTTSGLRNLRVQEFLAQPIPLPPLEEQRRIVAHLEAVQEKVNAVKGAQTTTEAELQGLEQAILDKAFRGEL